LVRSFSVSLCLCGSFFGPTHAAEADGVARQAGVGEAGRLAEAVGRAQRVRRRLPRPAAEDVLLAVGRPARILLGARLVIALVVNVLAPLGDVAGHVEQAPRVGLLLADGMRLLARVVGEPGEVTELPRLAAERVIPVGPGP